MVYSAILAKSDPPETLQQHTESCLSVLGSIVRTFPFVPELVGQRDFYRHLFYAVFLHDVGKAASGFQAQLRDGSRWKYRHEILSAGFVSFIPALEEFEKKAIALAIITHHKSISELREGYATTDPIGNERYLSHLPELWAALDSINAFLLLVPEFSKKYLGDPLPPMLKLVSGGSLFDAYRSAVVWYRNSLEDREIGPLHSRYGIFLRGLLIACDHLASSGQIQIRAGLCEIASRLGIAQPRPFQKKSGTTKGNSILIAPTGSGKTEAALLWAETNQSTSGRIYYVLPYTASINAMYQRFVDRYKFGEENVGVLHGKAAYYVYKTMMDRQYEREAAEQFARKAINLTRQLYRPIRVLTPFQILKALFGFKGWESMVSEMAGATFVFDEIHVYEPHTTALILRSVEYLSRLDAKFLFLSATFPTFLKERIRNILDVTTIELDSNDVEEHRLLSQPRHSCDMLDGQIIDHISRIVTDIKKAKRVLVVCNTVRRAQEVFGALRKETSSHKLLHGRFILRHREAIERELAHTQLLVGTQAVEVSLDIDFDVLYTEPAPIDALIQRLGRVNRRGIRGIAPVYIFSKGSDKDKYFYDSDRIATTLEALSDVRELTETRVADLVEQVYGNGYNQQEQKEFDRAWRHFGEVLSGLVPFDDSEKDEDFWELIRSLEVVPIRFEPEYRRLKAEKQYFEAMKYFASISFGQGAMLRASDRICFRRDDKYWVVDARYHDDLGLIVDQSELGVGIID